MSPSATAGPNLDTIAQIALTVADLDRAVAFYRDALGIPLLFQAPPGLAFFKCGSIRLMFSKPDGEFKPGPRPVLYFNLHGIEAAHCFLEVRGVTLVFQPHFISRI